VLFVLRLVKRLSSLAIVLVAVAVVAAVTAGVVLPQVGTVLTANHGTAAPLTLDALNERSAMFAADGTLLTYLVDVENREPVTLEEIPQEVIDAVLAMEDADFYRHNGVNPRGTLRALFENISAGGIEQGGSTITMQLVKNSLLSSAQNLDRKTTEAFYALRLERQMTKDEILERYLNTVYFGGSAYGVQAAAEQYWGIDAGDLGWEEAALLAGLIRNPVNNDPTRFPERARARRLTVIDRLLKQGLIDEEEAARIRGAALPAERNEVGDTKPRDYFARAALEELLRRDDILGSDPAKRRALIYNGGLRIHTTLDLETQEMAQRARDELLPLDPRNFTAALVAVETTTGAVRAMVGGPGFDLFQYNIATQGLRQPGSSMKTFVLAALFEQGYSPNDQVRGDSPCSFENPGGVPDPYEVKGPGSGLNSIAHHARVSSNCSFVRLGLIAGLDRVVDVAQRMGIGSRLDPVLSLPLGSKEVLPIDMATAYATIGNDGLRNLPYYIDRIEDRDGKVIYEHRPFSERAISVQSARVLTSVLEQALANGTGREARLAGGHRAAGKTGTAQNYEDAWFVGFTPYLTTAVWMGNPDEKIPMTNVGQWGNMFGGKVPAAMFGRFMNEYHAELEPFPFFAPEPVNRSVYLRTPGEIDSCTNPGSEFAYSGPTVLVDSDGDGKPDCFNPVTTTAPPTTEPAAPEPTTGGNGGDD
jgi:penicillin-binding protein 1A